MAREADVECPDLSDAEAWATDYVDDSHGEHGEHDYVDDSDDVPAHAESDFGRVTAICGLGSSFGKTSFGRMMVSTSVVSISLDGMGGWGPQDDGGVRRQDSGSSTPMVRSPLQHIHLSCICQFTSATTPERVRHQHFMSIHMSIQMSSYMIATMRQHQWFRVSQTPKP